MTFKAKCGNCHATDLFTDERFHNNGLDRTFPTDSGRAHITSRPADRGLFKVPSLRNVARTAPYMHDGSLATLSDVVDFYDKGGRPNPGLVVLIQPLRLLPEEKAALIKFLEALNSR